MKAIVLSLALLLFVSPIGAESDIIPVASETEPEIIVDLTPKGTIKAGMLVKIDASKSDVDDDIDSLKFDDINLPVNSFGSVGRIGFFAASPGVHEVVIAGGKTVGGKARVKVHRLRIQVDGTQPGPRPVDPINPTPPPDPPPSNRFGLTEFVRLAAISKLNATQRTLCPAIAENWRNVANDKSLTTLGAANLEIKAKNNATTKETPEAPGSWTLLLTQVNGELNRLFREKLLNIANMSDVREAFLEISAGFAAVK